MVRVISRASLIGAGVGAVATAVVGGAVLDLVERGSLPGKYRLDSLLGRCDVPAQHLSYSQAGPSISGSFQSKYRRRHVGYSIYYPPGHGPGAKLPLVVMLHGFGGDHIHSDLGRDPARVLAVKIGSKLLKPMACVTVDGGPGYWNPHPTDDPFGMVVHELIPLCQARGLGRASEGVAAMGISMGGYGAILFGERAPGLIRAVAAISPAIWTSYAEARAANSLAYASAKSFEWADVVAHADLLAHVPVRIAIGADDPFVPGVEALEPELSSTATVIISQGCHTDPFFAQQLTPSLQFVSRYVGAGSAQ